MRAIKVLCAKAMAWKAWTETRSASANLAGETSIEVGGGSDGLDWSSRQIAGLGGPKGERAGETKSISKGES